MAEPSGTKRKATDDLQATIKKKKVAAQPGLPLAIKVSSVVRSRLSPPVIATSPGLCLPGDVQFYSYTNVDPQNAKKRKKDDEPADLLLHSSAHRMLDYTAREDKPKDMGPLLKHYLCVFNPETGELEVVEAKKMVVRGVVRARNTLDAGMAERPVTQSIQDRRNDLGEAFGTKKARNALKEKAENVIKPLNAASASDAVLLDIIQERTADMATPQELQMVLQSSKPIPRGNFDADNIHDVYQPNEIIGVEVLDLIPVRDWQEKVRKHEEIEAPSRFVANRIARVASNAQPVQRLKILRYLLFLIIFNNLTKQGKSRGARLIGRRETLRKFMAPAPEAVIENIRRKFSDRGEMHKTHVDLLMTHCCVFASIIDNFETNTFDLREDLKLEQKDIKQYFSEIGAQVVVSKAGNKREDIAKLALPLRFPKLSQGRRRR